MAGRIGFRTLPLATNTLCDGGYAIRMTRFRISSTTWPLPLPRCGVDGELRLELNCNGAVNQAKLPRGSRLRWPTALPQPYDVGNEEYGSWEYDLHSTPEDPTIYAAAVWEAADTTS